MFTFFSDTDFVFTNENKKCIVPVLKKILDDNNFIENYINIIFLDDEKLLEINKEFLQHDYYTDIITFSYNENRQPIEAELYISIERVRDNAVFQNCSFENELYRVLIHGVLHLIGIEDSTEELKCNMQLIENQYLNQICFT